MSPNPPSTRLSSPTLATMFDTGSGDMLITCRQAWDDDSLGCRQAVTCPTLVHQLRPVFGVEEFAYRLVESFVSVCSEEVALCLK
jgi:hypothetical protein